MAFGSFTHWPKIPQLTASCAAIHLPLCGRRDKKWAGKQREAAWRQVRRWSAFFLSHLAIFAPCSKWWKRIADGTILKHWWDASEENLRKSTRRSHSGRRWASTVLPHTANLAGRPGRNVPSGSWLEAKLNKNLRRLPSGLKVSPLRSLSLPTSCFWKTVVSEFKRFFFPCRFMEAKFLMSYVDLTFGRLFCTKYISYPKSSLFDQCDLLPVW